MLRNPPITGFVYAVPRCTGLTGQGTALGVPSLALFYLHRFRRPRVGGSHPYISPHPACAAFHPSHLRHRTWKWRYPTLSPNKPIVRSRRPRPDPVDDVYSSATPPTGWSPSSSGFVPPSPRHVHADTVAQGLFYLLDKINGYRRLFSVTDTSLAHPYADPERVPVWLLAVLCGIVPAVFIILIA